MVGVCGLLVCLRRGTGQVSKKLPHAMPEFTTLGRSSISGQRQLLVELARPLPRSYGCYAGKAILPEKLASRSGHRRGFSWMPLFFREEKMEWELVRRFECDLLIGMVK